MKNTKYFLLLISIIMLFNTCTKDKALRGFSKGRPIGGDGDQEGYDVIDAIDGGYILLGTTTINSAGKDDILIIKTDNSGNTEWSKTFGGSGDDVANSIKRTTDNGYIILGATRSYADINNFDVFLIKTDQFGNLKWYKTFGGENYDRGFSIEQTTDNGFILLGFTSSFGSGGNDMFLIKTDNLGNEEWNRTFGNSGEDEVGYSIKQTKDNGYLLLGDRATVKSNNFDIFLLKTDSVGNEEWSKTFEGTYGRDVFINDDESIIILGGTMTGGNADVYLIKTDKTGNLLWSKTYGGKDDDDGEALCKTADMGFAITGMTDSYGNGTPGDLYFIKVDKDGTMLSEKIYGNKKQQQGEAILQNKNGQFIIFGTSWTNKKNDNDMYLVIDY